MKSILKSASLLMLLSMFVFVSCKEDEPTPAVDPIASFVATQDSENFLTFNFTNASQNAESYAWDFGDGNTSTEFEPSHTYEAAGTFTVKLTATSASGATDDFQQDVTITDPNEQLTLLAGSVSKDWKLLRDGAALGVGPTREDFTSWFALANDGTRPCFFDDVFTFSRDGGFTYNDGGTFFGEGNVYGGTDKADLTDVCFEATADNLTVNGNDYSAWLSSTSHTYTFDSQANNITLSGQGAWMGLIKLATAGEVAEPQSSVSFSAFLTDGGATGVDTLEAVWDYNGVVWVAKYVSNDGTTAEPPLVSFKVDFSFAVDGRTVTFTDQSTDVTSYSWDFGDGNTSTEASPVHTYAADGTYTVVLTGTGGDNSGEVSKDVIIDTPPADLPTDPTEPEANVISIYSEFYTNITGVNLDPDWGQATVTEEFEVAGGNVLKMLGLNYQGIDFAGNAQDVSGKTTLHLDIWCADEVDVNVSLISLEPTAENASTITTTAGAWLSVDIPLTDYTVPDLSGIAQMKFDDTADGAVSPTIYVDNIYFK